MLLAEWKFFNKMSVNSLLVNLLNLSSDEKLRFHPEASRHLKELISMGESFHHVKSDPG